MKAYQTLRRQVTPDIIHIPEYISSALISLLYRAAPLVFTEPGNIYERVANGNPYDLLTTQIYKLAARVTARRCTRCIATSQLMRDWWEWTGVPSKRLALIPLGVDMTVFQRTPEARARLGWAPDAPVLLYAARLSRENGVEVMLRAAARLRPDHPDLQLHILGDGPEKAALQRLACQLGLHDCTHWHGWIDFLTLPLFYSAATVFGFSGFSGGTPRVMLQAMACGAPVVASTIGGIVDHIEHGQTGLLFPPGDADAMAAQIRSLLVDPALATRLSQQAYAYVEEHVSWDRVIERIQALYLEVLSTSQRLN